MKRYFTAGLAIVLALSLGTIFYGAWLNERGEFQIARRMEDRRVVLHGEKAAYRSIRPRVIVKSLNLETNTMADAVALVEGRITDCLEDAGLCLPSKGEALRRWIRIRPDGNPFIQTLIAYFKLNYMDGKIFEAKAYLEQSPYIHHNYFNSYEKPVRLDICLVNGKTVLPFGDAVKYISQCAENRVRLVRLYGGADYGDTEKLLEECRKNDVKAELVLDGEAEKERLEKIAGADSFMVELHSSEEADTGMKNLAMLHELGASSVMAKWTLTSENASELPRGVEQAKKLGVEEFIITGFCGDNTDEKFPGRTELEKTAEFIRSYEGKDGMMLSVDSCFSPLRAYLGGEDPKWNGNRGITRGCEAGRSFCAITADGAFSPCLMLASEKKDNLNDYWENSAESKKLRQEEAKPCCKECVYVRRCLPCAAIGGRTAECQLGSRQ